MKLFPSYETAFSCDCTLQEATERIAKATACEANGFKLKSASYNAGTQKIVLYSKPYSVFFRNSFAPVATLELKKTERGSSAHVTFSLRKHIKAFVLAFCACAILLGLAMFAVCLFRGRAPVWPVFLPFLALPLAYVFMYLGLRFSIKRMLEVLHYALTGEVAKRLPLVHRC